MKTSKTELQARKNQAWNDCKDFLEAHTNADGIISAEDKAVYDEMLKKVDAYDAQIALVDSVEAREKEMNQATSEPITSAIENKVEATGRNADSYKKIFEDYLRGVTDNRAIRNALQEGTNSEGGYLVPEEFERRVIDKLTELNVIRQYAHVIRTSSPRKIPVEASAGVAAWIAEEGAFSGTDPAFGQVTLDAFKVGQIGRAHV